MRRPVVAFVVAALALTVLGPVILPRLAAPVAAGAPVDIRGTWSGIYYANIGDFPSDAVVAPDGELPFPDGLSVDSAGSRGRLFVASATNGTLDVIDGQPRDPTDIHVQQRIAVGHSPGAVVTAPTSGRVFVAVEADCRIAVVDGRGPNPGPDRQHRPARQSCPARL